MNRLFLFAIVATFTGGTYQYSCRDTKSRVQGLHLVYNAPVPDDNGGFIRADTYYDVYTYKDLMMYKVFYIFDSLVNDRSVSKTERVYYLVFHKDSLYGRAYFPDNPYDMPEKHVKVDSVKSHISYESTVYDTFALMKPDSTYYSGTDLVKAYELQPTTTFPERFTYSFIYSKGIFPSTETFSKAMDNVNGMKLSRIRMFGHGAYWPQIKRTYPQREISLEMTPVTQADELKALEYFKKYMKGG